MSSAARLEELRARIQLSQGSASLLLAIADSEPALAETKRLLLEILRATPMDVADMGECRHDMGPARWAEITRAQPAEAFVLSAPAQGPPRHAGVRGAPERRAGAPASARGAGGSLDLARHGAGAPAAGA